MNFLWDIKSHWYHAVRRIPGIRWILEQENRNLRDLIVKYDVKPALILDIGTGAGSSLDVFPPDVPAVAVDRSPGMLKQAGKRRAGLLPVTADAQFLPFKSGCTDFCACIGVTEYLSSADMLFREVYRVLSPGGWFLYTSARPSFFNQLRMCLGHRMNLMPDRAWAKSSEKHGFYLLGRRMSWLQHQWLLKKLQ
ncbi:class I SAM-dependent methyltransferase [bacterium]|nr:class I SAM-dependent methyltransferase [bacterium]